MRYVIHTLDGIIWVAIIPVIKFRLDDKTTKCAKNTMKTYMKQYQVIPIHVVIIINKFDIIGACVYCIQGGDWWMLLVIWLIFITISMTLLSICLPTLCYSFYCNVFLLFQLHFISWIIKNIQQIFPLESDFNL